ncbi:MAG: ShlB/FhaC/HecB family hemolysin secretion/activation protein [Novosphingobium meiothermophilum]|uniref:ShlB/FhaC/HecB family hemolysin secretion/activation protein n=1 Tax=Novosphingobium meiothermophilum TaxID=2202251 RepID=UPI001F21D46A|nr:ShlB/FhaC/HecB family hemolysin secretion/activation protein [Novosphingobium meiothermophilum]
MGLEFPGTMRLLRRGVGAAGVALLAAASAASAQGLTGQAISPPSRDDLRGVTTQAPPPAARLSIKGGIERSPCPLDDPQYADIKVTLREVMFNGLKELAPAALADAWTSLAGTPQPISVLCEIRDAAGTILRNRGYLAAVQVPTQKIEDGKVRMEVIYARIAAVRARGETRGVERKLEQYLSALTREEVFNQQRAERYLLLARDLPGYNVQLTLKPTGTAAGELVAEVSVVRDPFALDLTVQNLAAQATGRFGGQARAQFFGLTGMGDATAISYYATSDFSEQHILQGSHEFRPGSHGLVVGGQLTYAWTRPSIAGLPANVTLDARTLYAGIYARYPLERSLARNLWLSGGFDLVNQEVDLIGPLTRDRIRVAWGRLDLDAIDTRHARPQWRLASSLELRQGLSVLDATQGCVGAGCAAIVPTSRFDGSARATVLRWQGEYERSLGDVSFLLAPRGQYAFRPLFAFEEFSAGNFTVGRGYDPGELIGDSAVGGTVELRGPRLALASRGRLRVQPFVFADAAWVWNKGLAGSQRLTSAGGGVRGELASGLRLDATLAVPLESAGLQGRKPDPRFLVSLTTRLVPWRSF